MLRDLVNTAVALGLAVSFAAGLFGILWIPALVTKLCRRLYGVIRRDLAQVTRLAGPDHRVSLPLHHRSADPLP